MNRAATVRRHHLQRLGAVALLLAAPAWLRLARAQVPPPPQLPQMAEPRGPGRPSGPNGPNSTGSWVILQARYGTAERSVDVTQRLRELARRDERFRMGNTTFGVDPHPNRVKTLRILARAGNGQERSFEYAEGSIVDGAQFAGWGSGNWGGPGGPGGAQDSGSYLILEARYGTAQRNVDVTQRLKQLARRDREFRMGNSSFGVDPHPNRVKALRIFTRGPDGRPRTFEYTEGQLVDGSQFKGWARGDWGQGGGGGWGGPVGGNGPGSGNGGPTGPVRPQRLVIVGARYGAGPRQRDVSQALRALLRGNALDVQVDNGLAGGVDPAPNQRKELTLTYTLGEGANARRQTVRVAEGDRLRLP